MSKRSLFAVAFMAVAAVVTFLFAGGLSQADSLQEPPNKRVLVVGMEAAFKPYEFRDSSGEIVGFDVDIVNDLVQGLGWEVQYVDMAFDALIPALVAGKIDMIASGLSITPERAQRINFSRSYYAGSDAEDCIIVRIDDSIAGLEEVEGRILAVQLGSTQDLFMTGLETVAEIRRFKSVEDCMREVLLQRADFAFVARTVTENILEAKDFKGKLKISAFVTESTGNGVGFGFAKENQELRDIVDRALGEYMETQAYRDALERWNVQ